MEYLMEYLMWTVIIVLGWMITGVVISLFGLFVLEDEEPLSISNFLGVSYIWPFVVWTMFAYTFANIWKKVSIKVRKPSFDWIIKLQMYVISLRKKK